MFSHIFIHLAAMANALMDSVEHEGIVNTIFNKLNPKFWSKRISCDHAIVIFKYKLDAWHIAKTLMVLFLCTGFSLVVKYEISLFPPWLNVILLGGNWILSFNLYYNKIFRKRGAK